MASAPHAANVCDFKSREPNLLVSRSAIREKLRDALRLHVGRGRRFTVKELSNGSGVPDRVIECAMCDPDGEDYRPLKLEDLASIAKFLGAPFASQILELSDLGAFELADRQPPLPRVLSSTPPQETHDEKRKRLIRELAELEGL